MTELIDSDKQTEELCALFSSTLAALSADASAVRQLTDLAQLSGVTKSKGKDSDSEHLHEDALAGLRDLDNLVAGIEQKVVALRQIVTEEKRALQNFKTVIGREAEEQKIALRDIQNVYHLFSADQRVPESTTRSPSKGHHNSYTLKNDNNENEFIENQGQQKELRSAFVFQRVRAFELKYMSRNVLGRISLLDLNEALEEIEEVCQKKLAALPSKRGLNSNSLQRRYEYLKQKRANVEVEVEAHSGHAWVSEQELREHCAFFRHGESTARATLSILRSLKRLKQVPGRNMEITYICLFGIDEPHNLPTKELTRTDN